MPIKRTGYHDLVQMLNDINQIPERFDELSVIELKELNLLLSDKFTGIATEIFDRVDANPDYEYSPKFKNNKIEYWAGRVGFNGMSYNQIESFIEKVNDRIIEIKRNEIKKLEVRLKKIKHNENQPTKNTTDFNKITGFKTTLTEPQQSKLYKALQNNYIDCSEVEFVAIFTDNPKPLKWFKTNILLAYFVGNCKKITDNSKWKKASQIFSTKNNLQQSLNNNPYPKGFEKLETIINSI